MADFVVLGSKGILGSRIVEDLADIGNRVVAVSRDTFDHFDIDELNAFLRQHPGATIVNCVAFMPADKCEREPENSHKINVEFVEMLAHSMKSQGDQKLIQFSSDFVFNGESSTPYTEESTPSPLNVYGAHKAQSENIVGSVLGDRARVIRFSSLVTVSQGKTTFLEKVTAKARAEGAISLVADLKISIATSGLISKVTAEAFHIDRPIIHAVHGGETTWLGLASKAFDLFGLDINVTAVKSSDFASPARRPLYSVLQPSEEVKGIDADSWDLALEKFLAGEPTF